MWRSSHEPGNLRRCGQPVGWLAAAVLFLGGCGNPDTSDLQDYVSEVRKESGGHVEPLPEIQEYDIPSYTVSSERSPFIHAATTEDGESDEGPAPDEDREREHLERYALDSLRMVGLFSTNGRQWALVQTPDGTVHRVTTGNYLGENHGRVVEIGADGMAIRELVPDGSGGWREREAALALDD